MDFRFDRLSPARAAAPVPKGTSQEILKAWMLTAAEREPELEPEPERTPEAPTKELHNTANALLGTMVTAAAAAAGTDATDTTFGTGDGTGDWFRVTLSQLETVSATEAASGTPQGYFTRKNWVPDPTAIGTPRYFSWPRETTTAVNLSTGDVTWAQLTLLVARIARADRKLHRVGPNCEPTLGL